jgi:ABC-type microcin C transport system duplicated ATPase subunit YejF
MCWPMRMIQTMTKQADFSVFFALDAHFSTFRTRCSQAFPDVKFMVWKELTVRYKITMLLTRIRIQNYRCFDDVTIRLGPKVLLIGENDTGKSALLNLLAAIFGTQHTARWSPEDLYIEVEEEAPEERAPVEIEMEFRPDNPDSGFTEDEYGFFSEQFDIDDTGRERLRIHVRYFYDTASERTA